MKNLVDFKHTHQDDNFIWFDIKNVPFTPEELFDGIYKEFLEMLHISASEMVSICEELAIPLKSWFEYDVLKGKGFLVKEDGVYTRRWERVKGQQKEVITHYDVYVGSNSYSSLAKSKVAEYVIKQRYGWLWDIAPQQVERRFTESIHNLPKNVNAKIGDIDRSITFDNDLTISDLIKLYTDESYKDSKVTKYGVSIYANSDDKIDIFVKVGDMSNDSPSLYLLLSDLDNKDWSAVCERTAQEHTDKGWQWCKQEETKWFTSPIVEEVKKHFS